MSTVKRIGPASAFKVGLVLYGLFGLIFGVFVSLFSVAGLFAFGQRAGAGIVGLVFGTLAIVILPVLYGLLGGIMAAVMALLYNLAARYVGGIEIEMS